MLCKLIFVSILVAVFPYISFLSRGSSSCSSSYFVLHGSNHLGRYGAFIDTFPRPKNKKAEKLANEINLPTNIQSENGADLRRNRERNLKTYKENNPYDVIKVPEVPMNLTPEAIASVIKSLNMILNNKTRSELSDAERVGLVNWYEFDKIARVEIDNYETDSRYQKKLLSWTKYHIRKRDIVFAEEKWFWDNTRLRRHGRVRGIIVPRSKPSKVDSNSNEE